MSTAGCAYPSVPRNFLSYQGSLKGGQGLTNYRRQQQSDQQLHAVPARGVLSQQQQPGFSKDPGHQQQERPAGERPKSAFGRFETSCESEAIYSTPVKGSKGTLRVFFLQISK
jgi:hypothetical protein